MVWNTSQLVTLTYLNSYTDTTGINTLLSAYTDTTALNTLLSAKQNILTAGANIAITGNTIYASGLTSLTSTGAALSVRQDQFEISKLPRILGIIQTYELKSLVVQFVI